MIKEAENRNLPYIGRFIEKELKKCREILWIKLNRIIV